MRKAIITILAAFATLVIASCSKSPADAFCGSYSFKTGGYVEFSDNEGGLSTRYLAPESGQMHILPDDGGKVKVTMNVTGGNPYVFDGTVENGTLTLLPMKRKVKMYRDILLLDFAEESMVSVSGTGSRYGDTVIFEMEFNGELVSGQKTLTIVSSSINCIATENE